MPVPSETSEREADDAPVETDQRAVLADARQPGRVDRQQRRECRAQPTSRPSAPPASDSRTLSVSSWRTMRPRAAPSAARIAISRWRPVARTSSRLATFAQAISSTKPTAPSSTSSDVGASSRRDVADRLRRRSCPSVRAPSGTCARKSCADAPSRALRLLQRDAGLQPAQRLEVVPLIGACWDRTGTASRSAASGRTPGSRTSSEHADDGVRLAAERDRLADDVGIARRNASPRDRVADHRDARSARTVFVGGEACARGRPARRTA